MNQIILSNRIILWKVRETKVLTLFKFRRNLINRYFCLNQEGGTNIKAGDSLENYNLRCIFTEDARRLGRKVRAGPDGNNDIFVYFSMKTQVLKLQYLQQQACVLNGSRFFFNRGCPLLFIGNLLFIFFFYRLFMSARMSLCRRTLVEAIVNRVTVSPVVKNQTYRNSTRMVLRSSYPALP